MWAGALFVIFGASLSSGWHTAALNQLLPHNHGEPGAMVDGEGHERAAPPTVQAAKDRSRRAADQTRRSPPLAPRAASALTTLPPSRSWPADVAALSDRTVQQLASSMTIAGAAVGSFLDLVPRHCGFRTTLVGPVAFLFIAGTIACSFPGLEFLLPGRFATGVAAGLTGVVAPVLLAETSAPAVRGKLTALHQLGITIGVLMSSVIGLGFVRNVHHGWRYVFWGGTLPPLLLVIAALLGLLPESPRWLIRRGGKEGRRKARLQLYGLRPLDYDVETELRMMIKEARRERSGRTDEVTGRSGRSRRRRRKPGQEQVGSRRGGFGSASVTATAEPAGAGAYVAPSVVVGEASWAAAGSSTVRGARSGRAASRPKLSRRRDESTGAESDRMSLALATGSSDGMPEEGSEMARQGGGAGAEQEASGAGRGGVGDGSSIFSGEGPRAVRSKSRGSRAGGRLSRASSDDTLRDAASAGAGHLLPVAGPLSISWAQLCCSGAHRHLLYPVFVGVLLVLGMTCSGINVVLLYSSRIFGFIETFDPMASTSIVFGVYVAATLVGTWLVDRLGRRTLLIWGYTVMAVALGSLGVALLAVGSKNKDTVGWFALACVVVFVAAFAVGPGVATFVVLSEIVPTVIRVRAFSIFMATNWAVQLALGLLALDAIGGLGHAAAKGGAPRGEGEQQRSGVGLLFLAFAAASCVAAVAVTGLVPETRGASLETVRKTMLARWKRVQHETDDEGGSGGDAGCLAWCCCCAAGRAAGLGPSVAGEDGDTATVASRGDSLRIPMLASQDDDGTPVASATIDPVHEDDDEHNGSATFLLPRRDGVLPLGASWPVDRSAVPLPEEGSGGGLQT